jgi:hypothetical protein
MRLTVGQLALGAGAGLFLFVAAIQASIDIRLFHDPAVVAPVLTTACVTFAVLLAAIASMFATRTERGCCTPVLSRPYWIVTFATIVYLLSCDVIGLIGAAYTGLRVVTGPQYLRMTAVTVITVARNGLRPPKAW